MCVTGVTIVLLCINCYCYPVCVCAAGLYAFGRVGLCICMSTRNMLFSALLLKTLLLGVICCLLFKFKCFQCGLLCPVSCTDGVMHAFQIRRV